MNSPSTYAEWCDLIDEIEKSRADLSLIDTIRLGDALLNEIAAERLYQNICEMVQKRVNNAQELFRRQIDNAKGSILAVSSAIKTLANEYQFVYLVVQNMPMREKNKTTLLKVIYNQADQTQTRLKEIAIKSQNEILVSLIYKCPVNFINKREIQNSSEGETI